MSAEGVLVTVLEQQTKVAEVSETEILVTVDSGPSVEIGVPGVSGPQGPPGPAGGTGYTHTQSTPAATWIVSHNLARYPQVTVVDNSGQMVIADLIYGDPNNLTLVFASPFAGKAYLQ